MRQTLRHSFLWAGAESIVSLLAAMVTTLLVGRIIGPAEFGLAALAYAIGSLAEIIVATTFVDPLIQRRRLNLTMVDAAFSAMLALGAGMYVLLLALAPLLARLYDKPALTSLLAMQGTTCLLLGLRGASEAILARKLRFRPLAIRNIFAKAAGVAVSLAAALAGMGAASIILGNVAFAAGSTAMVLSMVKRMPKLTFLPDHIVGFFAFGKFSVLDALLWTATSRLFISLVGYFQGMPVLGQLNIAFRINDTVSALIGAVTTRLALPMFSRVAENVPQLEQAFLQGTRMVCLLIFPVFLGIALTSQEIISIALGPKWPLAVPALTAVCLFSLLNFARVLAHSTVKAAGKPNLLIVPNIIGLIYVGAGSFLVRDWGFVAQLAVWMSFGVVFVLCSLDMIRKAIGTGWWAQLKPLGPAILPSLAMTAAVQGLALLEPAVPVKIMLLMKMAVGSATYLLFLAISERPLLLQILGRPGPIADSDLPVR